jgi:hypothetical protein
LTLDQGTDEEPAEHRRFARYLQALESVAEARCITPPLKAAVPREFRLAAAAADARVDAGPSLGRPRPTDNGRSPRHLNWSEPWASSVPLVSETDDQ